MKAFFSPFFAMLLSVLLVTACGANAAKKDTASALQEDMGTGTNPTSLSKDFKAYWYQGKAEVNSYALTQARYG